MLGNDENPINEVINIEEEDKDQDTDANLHNIIDELCIKVVMKIQKGPNKGKIAPTKVKWHRILNAITALRLMWVLLEVRCKVIWWVLTKSMVSNVFF
jgi:hypothetical protein